MTTYAIHAQALTHAEGGWGGSVQVPMFYLDSRVQGIVSAEHAAEVARGVIDPLGQLPEADLKVTAYQVDPVRESADLDHVSAQRAAVDAAVTSHAAAVQADSGHAGECGGAHSHMPVAVAAGTGQCCRFCLPCCCLGTNPKCSAYGGAA
jgi:hypothetical protein